MACLFRKAIEDLIHSLPSPKTATGKIQKFVLREREWAEMDRRIQGSTR